MRKILRTYPNYCSKYKNTVSIPKKIDIASKNLYINPNETVIITKLYSQVVRHAVLAAMFRQPILILFSFAAT